MNPLIFIDTNIFLDFYRFEHGDIRLKYLQELEKYKSSLILTHQVEMEFKKNRQYVLRKTIQSMKNESGNYNIPSILSDSQPSKQLKKKRKELNTQNKILKQRIAKIIKSPSYTDIVYQSLNRIFKYNSTHYLNNNHTESRTIQKLALERFQKGYPPRKNGDTSYGDAINWEWIIHCSINTTNDIIIVSRDGDFGITYNDESYLNDWLIQEFKERVGRRRKIILTEKLSYALKQLKSKVTVQMVNAERNLLENNLPISERLMRIAELASKRYPTKAELVFAKTANNYINQMNHYASNLLQSPGLAEAIKSLNQSLNNETLIKMMSDRDSMLKLVEEEIQ